MQSLHNFLFEHNKKNKNLPINLQRVIVDIMRASKYAEHAIRTEETGKSGNTNIQGEEQMALDVKCDQIFCKILSDSELIAEFASEEQEKTVSINGKNGLYSVAFDPLDGSSLLDTNGCVGTIFGIWEGNGFIGKSGNDLVAAGYIQYGPRTTAILSFAGNTHEFTLSDIGEYHLSKENISVTENATIFAMGNLRASTERPEYKAVLDYFLEQKKTLRYAGGMVPDINSILCKKSGIFTYPSHSGYPNGKLRLLYECAPMAYIMNNANASAVDEYGNNITDIRITELHQRTSIVLGSTKSVEKVVEILNTK